MIPEELAFLLAQKDRRNNRPECMECMKGFRLHIPKVVFHAGEQLKGCCKDRSSCKTRLRNNVIRFKN